LDDFLEIVPSACDVEYQAEVNQRKSALREAFEQLSGKQRATLELYFFEGYTLREISQQLNESLANIRHYYYRALERLKTSVWEESTEG
jgi:RNA polymerase sigma-70 factor (ECF subfamily)